MTGRIWPRGRAISDGRRAVGSQTAVQLLVLRDLRPNWDDQRRMEWPLDVGGDLRPDLLVLPILTFDVRLS